MASIPSKMKFMVGSASFRLESARKAEPSPARQTGHLVSTWSYATGSPPWLIHRFDADEQRSGARAYAGAMDRSLHLLMLMLMLTAVESDLADQRVIVCDRPGDAAAVEKLRNLRELRERVILEGGNA